MHDEVYQLLAKYSLTYFPQYAGFSILTETSTQLTLLDHIKPEESLATGPWWEDS